MAETYTGDEGDAALADGMDIMDGTEDRRDGWLAINKTRDYIAALKTWVNDTLNALWPLSIARGGTGANSAAGARTALGVVADGIGTGLVFTSPGFNRLTFAAPGVSGGTELAKLSDVPAPVGPNLTLTGHLYVPNSTPASSGWTAAYINSDGRLSRGASSLRYKEDIADVDPAELGDLFGPQLVEYQMIDGDGTRILGYIAEHLHADPATRRFVVYATTTTDDGTVEYRRDENGDLVPESIDFTQWMLARQAQLDARLTALEEAHHADH